MRNPYELLAVNPEGKRPHRLPSPVWEDNIKMDIKDAGCCGTDCFHQAQ
jgi:hypothetical protein